MQYSLLDSGDGEKLEKFGPYKIIRPCFTAVWEKKDPALWKNVDYTFSREEGASWEPAFDKAFNIEIEGIKFQLMPTSFGHLGIFPEHRFLWKKAADILKGKKDSKVLNLFAYTGGMTFACVKENATVCHVDASKPTVAWAKENAYLNFKEPKIRWIVDDAIKFMKREIRRNQHYDMIVMDPPSFGRGAKMQVFKIEKDINLLLELASNLLNKDGSLIFSCHTPGFTPIVIENLLQSHFKNGKIESGEMTLISEKSFDIPSGSFGIWEGK
ncbi:MAG TPA: class I SAM-dependent methyltransferase [Chlamydiales bacterium]|nr:class I SAM-dependent methyltransferase [Chlamydiales bacterium]